MFSAGSGPWFTHLQGFELLVVDEGKLRDEVVEVLVAGVDMGLGANRHEAVKVVHINVYEDSV